ncbi:MAG TPA: PEP-CTERM sorting domain-containing protein [Burkholderiaceae bacterium]|nr:PEP-CTERM sorting domain-containing protein [Burkholderiaceae bacterium]
MNFNHTPHRLAAASLAVLALATSSPAQAQATTDSLAGWNVVGDAVAQGGSITLTTAYLDGAGDQTGNLSGTSAADIATVESAAGVAPYALDLSATEYGTEGSLVGQSFAAVAGQTLSFDWSFNTLETLFQDHAFAVINGQVITLATAAAPGAASQSFSYTFAQSGIATLSFGVIDTVDYLGVSSLNIGNLQMTAPVPEPGTYAMLLAGLSLIGFVSQRRRGRRAED